MRFNPTAKKSQNIFLARVYLLPVNNSQKSWYVFQDLEVYAIF